MGTRGHSTDPQVLGSLDTQRSGTWVLTLSLFTHIAENSKTPGFLELCKLYVDTEHTGESYC